MFLRNIFINLHLEIKISNLTKNKDRNIKEY